jgi:hypothetical protein
MGLDVAGEQQAATRAYDWLLANQRRDGSWATAYRRGQVVDAASDANFCAYVAVGAWHHFLATCDHGFLVELWPTVAGAMSFALGLQELRGEINWARDAEGRPWPGALLTSSACIHLSLTCAIRIAAQLGHECEAWKEGRARLAATIRECPSAFLPKERYSMDWYYPVLTGVVQGAAAECRLRANWDKFVVDGLGVRCVSDRPWVTVAETCELVLALNRLGLRNEAVRLFEVTRQLRTSGGAYWTGVTFPDGERWPDEQPTWTAAAVLLAWAALDGQGPTASIFG